MQHVAIDLGGRLSQICVRASDGVVVEECRHPTATLAEYLAKRPTSRVIVETCAEAFAVADRALELGHEVRVVPATLVRTLGVGSRRTKNDRRDAQILSEVSCRIDLPSVHIRSAQARKRKTLCGMRDSLTGARTQLVNTVRGWLRTEGLQIRSGAVETFPKRVRERLAKLERTIPPYVERQLEAIEPLTAHLRQAARELEAEAHADPICPRLMSVPGVGPVTAIRYRAALDEISRFGNAHKVEAYLGLTPGEHSSSDKRRRLGITKAGPAAVRHVLVQAAWTARRCAPDDPMVRWSLEVEKRRGKAIAVLALVRKMSGILYALWRDGNMYSPLRSARPM